MNHEIVGKNIIRVDGYSKVTGKAKYPQDIYMDNMLYGKTLRSIKAHADIKIDISKAEKLKGVVKILTYKDILGVNHHGVTIKDHEVLCSKKVKRVGDPIAFVIANEEKIADEALKLIKVAYKELEAFFDPIEAIKDDATKIHESENNLFTYKLDKGNVDETFKECDVIVENVYKTQMAEHAFLQPEAGIAYIDNEGVIVIMVATQYPHFDVIEIAEALGINKKKIKVINTAVGGAFGGREDITLQIHLALAAKLTGKPVKAIYSRKESFLAHSKRHPLVMKYKTGANNEGKILAMEAEIFGDTGAYASWAINVLRKAGVHATGPYEIPNVKVRSHAIYTNNPYCGAMRGFGATQVALAYEQQIDEIAIKLNMNPFEIRRKNIFRINSQTATGQILYESVPLEKCLNKIENELQYNINNDDNKKIGVGIATSFYGTGYGNGFPDISKAYVKLRKDGKVTLYVGATEVGQGTKTILIQIASEVLRLKSEDILLINENSSRTPDAGTAAASRQTYNTGNAVKIACKKLYKKIIKKAYKQLELNSHVGLDIKNGVVYLKAFPQKNISFKELVKNSSKSINSLGIFKAQTTKMDLETGQGCPYWPYTFNACGVVVKVNEDTGAVEIIDVVLAQDVGKAINPSLVEGQMIGGFAMGLGYALMEDLKLKNGKIKNNSLTNYIIPTSLDMPEIKNIIIEDPESTGPFGAKGIGESVMIPVAPAIINAIYDAVGVRVKELPATPEAILKELKGRELNLKNITKRLIDIAAGREKAELVLKNCKIVNVFNHEVIDGDLAIDNGVIIGIGEYEGETEIDIENKYVSPGLIDSHVHIESSMVTPSQFARAIVPRGTTTVIADPHEIANVCGIDGIKYMLNCSEELPLNVYFMLPSCVPATPFEHAGAILEAENLKELIDNERILGLGELMNYPAVINAENKIVDKILVAKESNKIIDGHGPELSDKDLNAYVISGIKTEHECSTIKEMQDRLSRGMYIAIRQGSAARNLETLIRAVKPENSRRCTLCTDDRHPEDLLKDGHIDNNLRIAVKNGIDPITAIKMATLNTAECYGLKNSGAIAPGYNADIVIFDNLKDFNVSQVFKNGRLVAKNKSPLFEVKKIDHSKVIDTVNVKKIEKEDFKIKLSSDIVNVMRLLPHSLITEKVVRKVSVDEEGYFEYHKSLDVLKLAVVERHNATGNIGLGLVENFNLKNGAIASTIAHDSHNIVVIGDNDEDIYKAIEEVSNVGGGITIVSNGEVLDTLELPIAGLMSDKPMEEVDNKLNNMLNIAYDKLNVNKDIEPFMTLAFLALPVIPEIKVTDMGLFDVTKFDFIDISINE